MLFEGQADHLIPSTSQVLVQSDLFKMAGRMIGHSFLHGGPPLTGVSPAILHVLLGGSRETATIMLEDVADIDIRETIELLERKTSSELTEDQRAAVNQLALSWDLPVLTQANHVWLLQSSTACGVRANLPTSETAEAGTAGHNVMATVGGQARCGSSGVPSSGYGEMQCSDGSRQHHLAWRRGKGGRRQWMLCCNQMQNGWLPTSVCGDSSRISGTIHLHVRCWPDDAYNTHGDEKGMYGLV
ncbi:uncharacterized protein LOC120554262 [Perca fluviatilis]|uniref:uncharacterized protein LOC120554262 n=1 Tax=Perca fluviatilis TaxID=8168 RepID=UPI001963DA36|nr:uncharacterized protein LOC120554262 [Perca fluviatilis]